MTRPIITSSVLICLLLSGCNPSTKNTKVITGKRDSSLPTTTTQNPTESETGLDNSYFPLATKAFLYSVTGKNYPQLEGPTETSDLLEANRAYVQVHQKIASDLNILNSSKDGIDYILTATAMGATAVGITVPAAIAIEVANKALNQALEFGIGELEKKAQDEASKVLSRKLKEMSAKDIKEFESLKKLAPEEALLKTEKLVNTWIPEEDFLKLPAAERAEARAIVATWTARTALAKLAEHKSASQILENNLTGDLNLAKTELVNIGKTLKVFAGETRKILSELVENQENIAIGLNQINKEIQNQTQKLDLVANDVTFLRDFAFSRMTAREQLNYLKSQQPNNLSIQQKVTILEEKINFEENYQKYFSASQSLIEIAKNFGVNSQTVQDISSGIEKLNVVKIGFDSLSKGNYLSGVAALSSLLGGNDNSEAIRHRAILQRLDNVIQNQKLLSSQMQVSFQIQSELLGKISNQIRQSTEALYIKMDRVQNDVLSNRILLQSLVDKGLRSCAFISSQIQEIGLEKVLKSNGNFKRHLSACSLEYDNVFKQKDYETYFSLNNYKTPLTKDVIEAEESVFNYSLLYLSQNYNLKTNLEPTTLLRNPSENAFGLIQKSSSQNSTADLRLGELQNNLDKLKTNLLSPTIIKNVQILISIFPAINLWNSRTSDDAANLLDFSKLNTQAGLDDISIIDSALELTNIALQKESLLSGDILLPILYQDFEKIQSDVHNCDNRVGAKCLLQKNPLLFENFVVFALYKEFFDQKFSLASYRQQLRIKDDVKGLRALLKNQWYVRWNAQNNSYEATVAGKPITMPSYERIVEAKLAYTESVPMLLQMREDLIHLKTEMHMKSALGRKDQITIYKLFIRKD